MAKSALMSAELAAEHPPRRTRHTGIGLSQATLFDEKGPVGVASQTLLVQPAS